MSLKFGLLYIIFFLTCLSSLQGIDHINLLSHSPNIAMACIVNFCPGLLAQCAKGAPKSFGLMVVTLVIDFGNDCFSKCDFPTLQGYFTNFHKNVIIECVIMSPFKRYSFILLHLQKNHLIC